MQNWLVVCLRELVPTCRVESGLAPTQKKVPLCWQAMALVLECNSSPSNPRSCAYASFCLQSGWTGRSNIGALGSDGVAEGTGGW